MAPEKHEEHIEACSRVFVSWTWATGICVAIAMTVGGIAWAGSERLTKVDASIESIQSDVNSLKSMDDKLDTLIRLVK